MKRLLIALVAALVAVSLVSLNALANSQTWTNRWIHWYNAHSARKIIFAYCTGNTGSDKYGIKPNQVYLCHMQLGHRCYKILVTKSFDILMPITIAPCKGETI